MRRCLTFALAVMVLAAARPATAAVISFNNPDLILGLCTTEPFGRGPLRVYEEAGVRLNVQGNPPFVTVGWFHLDCSQNPTGLGPVIDPPPYGPIYMFAQDGMRISVTSLTGDAIRRIRLDVFDFRGGPGSCDLLFVSVGFSICDFSGDVNFADYGFPNGVTSFSLSFLSDNFNSVATIRQIEVPEPLGSTLFALGVAAAVRSFRQR